MKKSSTGILANLYDFWKPHVDEEEVEFYHKMVKEAGGPCLELASGTGRLLLRFCKEGLEVDGVESSPELLEIFERRCQRMHIIPTLYRQRLDALDITKHYHLIFITLGSFQFISDRASAMITLTKCYEIMSKGGKLIIPLFLPWAGHAIDTSGWKIVSDQYLKRRPERLIKRERSIHDPVEQIILSQIRLEIWHGKDLLEFYEKDLHLRWYSKNEFLDMLAKAGFQNVEVKRSYEEGSPIKPSFMLFVGEKS